MKYIKRAIYDPNLEVVKGFPRDLMQSYKETLTEDDVQKIIEYLKSLNENNPGNMLKYYLELSN
ncbi:MAG: hypothetical protein IPN67_20165 [Bacteroidales bacterium]|nr:hypothetical protein [Bacteroidales bacterium]